MMYPLPEGYEEVKRAADVATLRALSILTAPFVAGVLLIWWKLNRIMRKNAAPAVYTPPAVRVEFVQVAPEPAPDSYRDDTTGLEAQA